VIIFGKFGDGRSKEDRAVQVRATTGYVPDGVDSFHSRSLTRASFRRLHPSPISNRELDLLERGLSHCKQRTATVSNRELSTIRSFARSAIFVRDQVKVLPRGSRIAGRGSRSLASFLTGSALQTEIAVTHSKQTLATFLTGSRIARKRFAERQVQP